MRGLAGVVRQKLTIANGIPVTIALEYPTGKRVPSRIVGAPDQMFYSLTGNRSAYLPLEVGAMIEELGLQPGQPFTICKYGAGQWEVQPVTAEPVRPTPPRPTPQPAPPLPPAAQYDPRQSYSPAVVVAPGTAETTKLEHALKTAIQAAANAERFGSEIGYTVRFDADAIKSMAITVLINSAEGARR